MVGVHVPTLWLFNLAEVHIANWGLKVGPKSGKGEGVVDSPEPAAALEENLTLTSLYMTCQQQQQQQKPFAGKAGD